MRILQIYCRLLPGKRSVDNESAIHRISPLRSRRGHLFCDGLSDMVVVQAIGPRHELPAKIALGEYFMGLLGVATWFAGSYALLEIVLRAWKLFSSETSMKPPG